MNDSLLHCEYLCFNEDACLIHKLVNIRNITHILWSVHKSNGP